MKLADYPPQEPLSEAGLYNAHIGQNLKYLVDLSIRNTLVGDDPA
jgi:hypothetical protein